MSFVAKQSTARTFMIGPVLDSSGVAVTGGVVGDFKISKDGAAPAALNGSATATHRHTGFYSLALTASDLDTVGTAQITIDDTTNSCAMLNIQVVEEVIFDALYAASANAFAGAAGSTTLGSGAITATVIATGAIDADAIADNAIDAGAIAADAITAAKIADGAIDAATFATGAITAAAIAADAITDAKVASDVTIASVTGSVGSVTGNVGGNVVGSVASVTAGVTLANGAHGGTSAVITAERIVVASTTSNEPAMKLTGNGTAAGLLTTGGTSGDGLKAVGGTTTGSGIYAKAAGGNSGGIVAEGMGTAAGIDASNNGGTGAGVRSIGGTSGVGIDIRGGGTSGDGIIVSTTSGHGINLAPSGTSKHGILSTGGSGGTSDGVSFVAGTGGVGLRAGSLTVTGATTLSGAVSFGSTWGVTGAITFSSTWTGNLTGTVATVTTLTGHTPQTGDSFARIGATGSGLTSLAPSTLLTTALTESYRADGATGTATQLLYEILQNLTEFSIASTTKTVKKIDGSTTAGTYTLDSATTPTSITRAT